MIHYKNVNYDTTIKYFYSNIIMQVYGRKKKKINKRGNGKCQQIKIICATMLQSRAVCYD